jgi:hypothetical protein
MVAEVEEKYPLHGLLHYLLLEDIYKFNKKHGRYPARVILNPKNNDVGSTSFIPFPTNRPPAIEPLPINGEIEAPTAEGYKVDIEYDEAVDEKTLICRGFAILS